MNLGPTLNLVTLFPTVSTNPAPSQPAVNGKGGFCGYIPAAT